MPRSGTTGQRPAEVSTKRTAVEFDMSQLPGGLTDRTVSALAMRATKDTSRKLLSKYLLNYEGTEPVTLSFLQRTAVEQLFDQKTADWEYWLSVVRRSYDHDSVLVPSGRHYRVPRRAAARSFRLDMAQRIAGEPDKYPRYLELAPIGG